MSEESSLKALLSAVATLTDEVADLKREVASLTTKVNETRELVDAWQAVKTGGRFIKWLAAVGSGAAGVWLFVKTGSAALLK